MSVSVVFPIKQLSIRSSLTGSSLSIVHTGHSSVESVNWDKNGFTLPKSPLILSFVDFFESLSDEWKEQLAFDIAS